MSHHGRQQWQERDGAGGHVGSKREELKGGTTTLFQELPSSLLMMGVPVIQELPTRSQLLKVPQFLLILLFGDSGSKSQIFER